MKKFFMLFVMGFMIFSVSNAGVFSAVPTSTLAEKTSSTETTDVNDFLDEFQTDTGYTYEQIRTVAGYKTSTDEAQKEAYVIAMNTLSSKGYHFFNAYYSYSAGFTRSYYLIKTSTDFDFGYGTKYNSKHTFALLKAGDKYLVSMTNSDGSRKTVFNITSDGLVEFLEGSQTWHNTKVKQLGSNLTWTESMGYAFEPTLCNAVGEVSSDSSSTNYDLAGLISAITDSDVIKDSSVMANAEYFIIPYGATEEQEYFEVYFYHPQITLSAFEYLANDNRCYYDLDKTLVDGIIYKLMDFHPVIKVTSGLNYLKYFSIYHDITNNTYEFVYNGNIPFDSDTLRSLDSEKNPIIYTTKTIPYYHYQKDETTQEWTATPDTTKDITKIEVKDSEGNIISDKISSNNSSILETQWQRFINFMNNIYSNLLNELKKIFVPDFSMYKSLWDKLVSKFEFIEQSKEIADNVISSIELNPAEPPNVTVNLSNADSKYNWGTEAICLDLSWYAPYKPVVDFFIICIVYGYFFWNLFRDLPNIVSGVAGVGVAYNGSIMRDDYIVDRQERYLNKSLSKQPMVKIGRDSK